jgi:hypothetical protein
MGKPHDDGRRTLTADEAAERIAELGKVYGGGDISRDQLSELALDVLRRREEGRDDLGSTSRRHRLFGPRPKERLATANRRGVSV